MNNPDNDCSAQRRTFEQASGRAGDFQNGVGSGYVDFFRRIGNLITDPVGTANAMWDNFTDNPARFALETLYFNPLNPWTHIRNAYNGFQDDGWYGVGRVAGEQLARCTIAVVSYGACRAIGSGISAAAAKKSNTTSVPIQDTSNIGLYLANKAPNQVSPGITTLHGQYINKFGRVEPWIAHYDQFGRLIGRTDFNAGNIAAGIPSTHHHIYWWKAGYTPGHIDHLPGRYIP